MEIWNGTCEVHVKFSARALFELKSQYPEAVVLAHPECDPAVLAQADLVGSTSKLLEAVTKYSAKQFIVATEPGIFHQMRKKGQMPPLFKHRGLMPNALVTFALT